MHHAGFSGFSRFVARKKSRCKLISYSFVLPHDTIPSNVIAQFKKTQDTMKNLETLENLTKENPLNYEYWNDLGMEYKKQDRHRDAIVAYFHGVNAIVICKF